METARLRRLILCRNACLALTLQPDGTFVNATFPRAGPGRYPSLRAGWHTASHLRTITQAPLNPVTIDYDALGRRTHLALPNGISTEYQYDAASRLMALIYRTAAGVLGNLTYVYDPAGNRIGVGAPSRGLCGLLRSCPRSTTPPTANSPSATSR